MDEEPSFPRGRGPAPSLDDVKAGPVAQKRALEADAQDGAGPPVATADVDHKPAKRKRASASSGRSSSGGASGESAGARHAEVLSFKRLRPGLLVLGVVRRVGKSGAVVALPHNLTGQVRAEHVSPVAAAEIAAAGGSGGGDGGGGGDGSSGPSAKVKNMLVEGQFVRCVVIALEGGGGSAESKSGDNTKKIELSLLPNLVNAGIALDDLNRGAVLGGAVVSVEDYGYVVDVGVHGVRAFLPFKNVLKEDGSADDGELYSAGQIIDVIVDQVKQDANTVSLKCDLKKQRTLTTRGDLAMKQLLPGNLVTGTVRKLFKNGLAVSFLSYFSGTIDLVHLKAAAGPNWSDSYKLKDKVQARIIVVDRPGKKIYLSMTPHVVAMQPFNFTVAAGDVVDNAVVIRVDPKMGMLLGFGETDKKTTLPKNHCYVHISRVSDKRTEHLDKQFRVGHNVKARVVGFSPFDGLCNASMKQSVVNASVLRFSDVKPGQLVSGKVTAIEEFGILVALSESVQGIATKLHLGDTIMRRPDRKFRVGAKVRARVLRVQASQRKLQLTMKPSLVQSELPCISSYESEGLVGTVAHGFVTAVKPDAGVIVTFYNNVHGLVPSKELEKDGVTDAASAYPIGSIVKVKVLHADSARGRMRLTTHWKKAEKKQKKAKPTKEERKKAKRDARQAKAEAAAKAAAEAASAKKTAADFHVGEVYTAVVPLPKAKKQRDPDTAKDTKPAKSTNAKAKVELRVVLPGERSAFVDISHAADVDSWVSNPLSKYKPGQKVRCVVLPAPADAKSAKIIRTHVSLRPSLVDAARRATDGAAAVHAMLEEDAKRVTQVGELVSGYIVDTKPRAGCFVRLARGVTSRVLLKDLADRFVKDVKKEFARGKLVTGRVTAIDGGRVTLNLRPSVVLGKAGTGQALDGIAEGEVLDGIVNRTESYGAFVDLPEGRRGLCHVSQVDDKFVKDITEIVSAGDKVKVMVLAIDHKAGRISLTMKPSKIESGGADSDSESDSGSDSEADAVMDGEVAASSDEDGSASSDDDDDSDADSASDGGDAGAASDSSDDDSDESDSDGDGAVALPPTSAFDWDAAKATADRLEEESDGSDSDASSDEDGAADAPMDEAAVEARERENVDDDVLPENTEDFEKLLVASPHNSLLWVRYIAFQLSLGEVAAARTVAERALKTIGFRDEQEKLNVWVALLNLEMRYGTRQTLAAVFARALQHNDPKTVHTQMLSMYERVGRFEEAEGLYEIAARKFRNSKSVWLGWMAHRFRVKDEEGARALLPKALEALEKRKHVELIKKLAIMEFKNGNAERGRTLFDNLLDTYPKRLDLWSVYIDQEASSNGDTDSARRIFERVTALRFSSKKMRFLFNKWQKFEVKLGDEGNPRMVTEAAQRYVSSVTDDAGDE